MLAAETELGTVYQPNEATSFTLDMLFKVITL
jgi:hypothetical protein